MTSIFVHFLESSLSKCSTTPTEENKTMTYKLQIQDFCSLFLTLTEENRTMTYNSKRGTLDRGYSSLSASRRQSIGEEPDYKRVIGKFLFCLLTLNDNLVATERN